MRIVIAGGHGKIALILERLLSQRGDSVAGLIRNPDQVADLEAAGSKVEPLNSDLSLFQLGERFSQRSSLVLLYTGASD